MMTVRSFLIIGMKSMIMIVKATFITISSMIIERNVIKMMVMMMMMMMLKMMKMRMTIMIITMIEKRIVTIIMMMTMMMLKMMMTMIMTVNTDDSFLKLFSILSSLQIQ